MMAILLSLVLSMIVISTLPIASHLLEPAAQLRFFQYGYCILPFGPSINFTHLHFLLSSAVFVSHHVDVGEIIEGVRFILN